MNRYHFGGGCIASLAEFPELDRCGSSAAVDWTIHFEATRLGAFHADAVVEQNGELLVRRRDTERGFVLKFDDTAEYDIDTTSASIHVRHSHSVDAPSLRHTLLDQVLPRALSADGSLVVHASGIRFGEQAVMFLGPSGAGKSTIAAHCLQHADATLLGDDCFVLRHGSPTTIASTYRTLRLLPDTLGYLRQHNQGEISASAMSATSDKERVQLDAPRIGTPATLAAIVLLGSASEDLAVSMRELSQRDVVVGLVKNSFRADVTGSASLHAAFDHAAVVAENARGFQLEYPRDYAALPDVYSLIRTKLAAADTTDA